MSKFGYFKENNNATTWFYGSSIPILGPIYICHSLSLYIYILYYPILSPLKKYQVHLSLKDPPRRHWSWAHPWSWTSTVDSNRSRKLAKWVSAWHSHSKVEAIEVIITINTIAIIIYIYNIYQNTAKSNYIWIPRFINIYGHWDTCCQLFGCSLGWSLEHVLECYAISAFILASDVPPVCLLYPSI